MLLHESARACRLEWKMVERKKESVGAYSYSTSISKSYDPDAPVSGETSKVIR